ncbi:hypothetical protein L3N51_01583 [Metallosphaera sp. J1]|nr:hypothetical protein [Metallosphaera javensis (ex Hofmann et al. 2022)]
MVAKFLASSLVTRFFRSSLVAKFFSSSLIDLMFCSIIDLISCLSELVASSIDFCVDSLTDSISLSSLCQGMSLASI